ncbi:putative oligopeptide transporter, OPT superfamily [Dioscorea sansibarensis]
MWLLLKSCCGSFCWGLFKWMYAGGPFCGLDMFPAFGLQALTNTFYTSMAPGLIAVGLICPHIVSISYILGGLLSWGVFWPIIKSKEGIWFPPGKTQTLHGLYGYKILLTTAVFLGEGLFHISTILVKGFHDTYLKKKPKGFIVPLHDHHHRHNTDTSMTANLSYDDRLRTKMFLKSHIPTPITIGGFLLTGTISAVAIPFIFPQIEPIHIVVAYIIAPALNFCNAYGIGVSDFTFAPGYGRFSIFIFGSWIGLSHGGVLGSLVASSVVVAVMSPASDLIQNFKLAYMTLTSPRALLIGQAIGTAMGCVFGPIVFYHYYNSPNFGQPDSEYPAFSGRSYRSLAIAATQGSEGLPRHALRFAFIFFSLSLALNIVKELSKSMNLGLHPYIPYPIAMAIPFYLSANFSFDVGMGSLILYVWNRVNHRSAGLNAPTVASGLFAGDAIWSLVSALLYNQDPPICVRFFSRGEYMNLENNLKKFPL